MVADAHIDETQLLGALRGGDGDAYRVLLETYGRRLFATAMRLVRNEADANDVTQEAFLSAFRSIDRFDGACRIGTWLHRIVVNAALMKLRTRKRRPEEDIHSLLPLFTDGGQHTRHLHEFQELPEDQALRHEKAALIRRCIDQLPEDYRTALLLKDIEELNYEEISEALGLTRNAARVRVHRARQALRTLLAPHFEGGVE